MPSSFFSSLYWTPLSVAASRTTTGLPFRASAMLFSAEIGPFLRYLSLSPQLATSFRVLSASSSRRIETALTPMASATLQVRV